MSNIFSLSAPGLVTPLGHDAHSVLSGLLAGSRQGLIENDTLTPGRKMYTGTAAVAEQKLPANTDWPLPYRTRNNQLLVMAYEQIKTQVDSLIKQHGAARIGIVLGTSTSGIREGELAIAHYMQNGKLPHDFSYPQQELSSATEFLSWYSGAQGPRYVISTACSSSGKAFLSARRLLRLGLCDAVIVGGADSLCQLTLRGFDALESISSGICMPCSATRDGINIGEGAALFIMQRDAQAEILFLGGGESSDAHHISAPHPDGLGAIAAMQQALNDAQLNSDAIAYVNLHATGTPLNDAMESKAMHAVFGANTPCSGTKGMTGHLLGAAAVSELAYCWLLLSSLNTAQRLAPHVWDGQWDNELMPMALTDNNSRLDKTRHAMMSNSFAFGGNNVSLIIGRAQ
ncbi:MAG: beta-ketoacyl-[acyl-carrier-protein] synthase family protein [Gammaproteobacteria bacterium]|nr:beta-ketoacyl-[acyl-carrier-protein] synthase family protein [Gammaproteobacteria bacterium]